MGVLIGTRALINKNTYTMIIIKQVIIQNSPLTTPFYMKT